MYSSFFDTLCDFIHSYICIYLYLYLYIYISYLYVLGAVAVSVLRYDRNIQEPIAQRGILEGYLQAPNIPVTMTEVIQSHPIPSG